MKFDITKHEWKDSDISYIEGIPANQGYLCIILKGKVSALELNKKDATAIFKHLGDKEQAIAIAKHFGLTADDIAQPPQSKE